MLFVKSSKDKHESDIPDANIDSITLAFAASRGNISKLLKDKTNINAVLSLSKINELFLSLKDEIDYLDEQQLLKLEKQFAITGDMSFKNNDIDLSDKVFLFSIVSSYLLQRYQVDRDFNALNSAIRINDALLKLLAQTTRVYEVKLIKALFKLEANILESLNNGI